jgi:DNA methylase
VALQKHVPFLEGFGPGSGQAFDFSAESVGSPAAYEGILAFHKYWGKKPVEPLAFITERVSEPGDLVVDPFSGSGVTGFAAVGLSRRYLGIDINPIAVKLSSFVLNPPPTRELHLAFEHVARRVKRQIEETYRTSSRAEPATHYIWNGDRLQEIWILVGRRRVATLEPSPSDYETAQRYESYAPKFRAPLFFTNSRINAAPTLQWSDLFTGRALKNIDLMLDAIRELPDRQRNALELCLTASLGQMSKMVFAITGRGKKKGESSTRIEVGSWVIGFWRPPLHFEINCWNCFERKFDKLTTGISSLGGQATGGSVQELLRRTVDFCIVNGNALSVMSELPDGIVDLMLTDPPHSDRAPYLELSELWNAVLGLAPDFASEIVVSNAKERKKHIDDYNEQMRTFAAMAVKKLSPRGCIVVQFNARGRLSWEFLKDFETSVEGSGVSFRGTFPIRYSANSVVQDNRRGALTTDYALLFAPSSLDLAQFSRLQGWTTIHPREAYENTCR